MKALQIQGNCKAAYRFAHADKKSVWRSGGNIINLQREY